MAAAARVHGRDELEAGGVGDMGVHPRHHRAAAFHGLAQRLQGRPGEFRQLVEEEDAAVGERYFAGPCAQAAADEGGERGRVMRIAEGPVAHQPAACELARHRMDHGDLERRRGFQRRQQARQALGQHGLARTGRADHQQVVAAGRRDFERALGRFLALDVGEVEGMLAPDPASGAGAGPGSGCP